MQTSLGMDRIVCQKCGAQYRWKRELVGKQVKCACGSMFRVDVMQPPEDEYDLAPQAPVPVKPIRQTVMPTGIAYRSPATQVAPGVDAYIFDKLKDLQIPIALIAAGTIVEFAEMFFSLPMGVRSYRLGFMMIGIGLIIKTGILLAGAFAAAKLRGLAFGPFWIALLKLTAIAIAPGAVATLVGLALTPLGFLGSLGALLASFILYFALYGVLFDLDEGDTWFCVCVNFILSVLTMIFVLPAVFAALR